jgi:PAS domain S-box-containing protein
MGRQLSDGRLQAIVRDITDRKRAEEAMRRNEERFRVALKDSPITVFNQDSDLRYTWIYNPHVYWQQDAIGKTDEELLSVKKAAHLTALKKKVLRTGVAEREEVTIPHNGASYFVDMTVEPLFDSEGRVAGITGSCMDIARLREAAERLQDAKDKLAREKSYLENEIQTELGFEEIIGHSSELRDVLKKAKIVAPTDSTVLLLGETGTGKELVARSVHALSGRRDRTFIKLNCAAVPSGLLESELFGHEKGAFTSAVSRKVGRIELADKGTLFLDEIGELPLELQPKLLRVLQDREFERLGGVQTLHVDVRIIAATNRDLQHDIAQKNFREDLFYRLNVFPIELPPLRERQGDISVLVRYFVKKHSARMGKHVDTISDETMRILENWNWPGNIRELENLVERMVIMSKSRVLAPPPAELQEAQLEASSSLTALEREHIIRILRETNGVLSGTSGAANRLGLKRTTLQSMLKRLNIPLRDYRRSNGTYEV